MQEEIAGHIVSLLHEIVAIDSDIILLAVLAVVSIIVLDAVTHRLTVTRRETGMDSGSTAISIDGSKSLPVKNYVSDMQGLAGRPDALISEKGFIIPIERKPLAKKIRDRHVAQLLVYMRLVEEFEGKRPPYGYLIIGPNCRRIRISNSPERQAWLQKMIDEMRQILQGEAPAKAAPHPKKCQKCNVREHCEFAIGKEELVPIGNARSQDPSQPVSSSS